ncbi:efflux transporter outer membrane subunit [Sphingomonas sp. ASY06-1R]|uniref:efflux transporter outer membrane subunit n=1 Tax=Sphingomonas sp. ASY06-1R TaxID=3445771 RepID=UPI003FA2A795
MRTFAFFAFPLAGLLLAGCTVGPNYTGPPAAAGDLSHAGFARVGDLAVAPAPGVARWWEQLNDPTLNALETQALAASPDLAAAAARLRQARAAFHLERANQAPTASAVALYAHARLPGVDLGGGNSSPDNDSGSGTTTSLNLYNVGFDASWEIDLFGGQRRTIEAARAEAQSAEASLADAQVSLTAEIAQAYVNLRDRQQRIALNAQSVAMQEQMLALTRQRFGQGTASRLDVVRLQTQLENTRADTVPLDAEREQYLDELATLTGQAPGAVDAALAQAAPVPLPPTAVAIGDPAALLQRRPDIRAAERTLAARTARIGAAQAARFPRLSLMGLIGLGGTSLSDLSDLGNVAALGAPQLSWSFLDFGRNKARVTQAEAARDEAAAQYRGAVLAALRDAEGSLSRYRNRRLVVAAQARAQLSADEAVALSLQRYRAGTTTLTDLLDTQRQQIAVRQNLSLAQAGLTQDFVAIQKALGLGWS